MNTTTELLAPIRCIRCTRTWHPTDDTLEDTVADFNTHDCETTVEHCHICGTTINLLTDAIGFTPAGDIICEADREWLDQFHAAVEGR